MDHQRGKSTSVIDHKYLSVIPTQQLIVQKSSKASEPTTKKAWNEELPDWINPQWFRHTFVTTYMVFVGQTVDPWDVPAKRSVKVMQNIWDAASEHVYEITTSTAVYQKVRDQFGSRMILIYISDCSTPRGLLAQCHWIHRHCSHYGVFWCPRRFTRFGCRTSRVHQVLPYGSLLFV